MIHRRLLPVLCALIAVTALTSDVGAASGHQGGDERSAQVRSTDDDGPLGLVARDLQTRAAGGATTAFTGMDGMTYEPAATVVEGKRGHLFWGPDFDVACALGAQSQVNFSYTTKLARLIEKSGRRVIWTAAPNKANVFGTSLRKPTPHDACDLEGLAEQRRVIDKLDATDPTFLPLRKLLATDDREVYFKTDLHWTSVGGSVFAQAVAERLDPEIAARQTYEYGVETRLGLLNHFRGVDELETAQTARPTTRVEVRTARRSAEQWTGYPETVIDYSWNARQARKIWPGNTLLLGDSFMLYALESMRPVFRRGRFLFLNHVRYRDVIRAIKQSDTVVMETLQTFASFDSPLINPKFRVKLRRALL